MRKSENSIKWAVAFLIFAAMESVPIIFSNRPLASFDNLFNAAFLGMFLLVSIGCFLTAWKASPPKAVRLAIQEYQKARRGLDKFRMFDSLIPESSPNHTNFKLELLPLHKAVISTNRLDLPEEWAELVRDALRSRAADVVTQQLLLNWIYALWIKVFRFIPMFKLACSLGIASKKAGYGEFFPELV